MGLLFSAGLEMLFDGQQRFVRSGLEVFIRCQNFQSEGDFQEVGVPWSPTGTASANGAVGFTDILIDPPPDVKTVSTHDIGLSGGRLMFGAKKFLISHTFVYNMRLQYPAIKDDYDVFRNWDGDTPVIGIVNDNRLFSIEEIVPDSIAGRRISWTITANFNEDALVAPAKQVGQP